MKSRSLFGAVAFVVLWLGANVSADIVIDPTITLADVQISANAYNLRYDEYVPNDQVTPDNPSGNAEIARYASPFTGFYWPFASQPSVPVIITDSTGMVTFGDSNSYQICSDMRICHGAEDREPRRFSFVFVDPADIRKKAAASRVAFRTGSVVDQMLEVRAYDINNQQIGATLIYPENPADISFDDEISFRTVDSITDNEVSAIHRVELMLRIPESAYTGTFSDETYYFDLCFNYLQSSSVTFDQTILPTEKLLPDVPHLHPDVQMLNVTKPGPYINLSDGSLLTVQGGYAYISTNNGINWSGYNVFADTGGLDLTMSGSKSFLLSDNGVIVLVFMSGGDEYIWTWDKAINDYTSMPSFPIYTCRSFDEGRTWTDFQKIHQGYCGSMRDIIQTSTGRIVVTASDVRLNPGRHVALTFYSDNDGLTWHPSNILDPGAFGFRGNHEGFMEPSLTELNDGRLWLLIRTNMDRYYQAFSTDYGANWSTPEPTQINASTSPAILTRLSSDRLILGWNRLYPEGTQDYPRVTGQYSEIPGNWHRDEYSIAFSSDDGQTWTEPVVIIRQLGEWISYGSFLEREPGLIWLSNYQGGLQTQFYESDFVTPESPTAPFSMDGIPTLPQPRATDIHDYTMNPVDYEFVYQDNSPYINVDPPVLDIIDNGIYDHLRVTTPFLGSTGGSGKFVQAIIFTAFQVDPAVDGAISSIGYSYKQDRPLSNYDLIHLFAIEQDGKYYAYNTFQRDLIDDGVFTSFEVAGLTADDFDEERPDGDYNLITSSHPDFSADAPPLRFGLMLRMTLSLPDPFDFVTDFDDFNVVVAYENTPGYADIYGSADDLESVPGATSFRFEEYVSPITPNSYSDEVLRLFSPADVFINPNPLFTSASPLPDPVGIYVTADDATELQNVRFYDGTSYVATSDIYGPGNIKSHCRHKKEGYDDLIFFFADPAHPDHPAAVSRVGFRFGGLQDLHHATIDFYDIAGNKLNMFADDAALPPSDGSFPYDSSCSYIARADNGDEAPLIHKVVLSGIDTSTYWCVGSYADSAALNDMSYYGLVSGALSITAPDSSVQRLAAGNDLLIEWQCTGIMTQLDTVTIKYYDGQNWVMIDPAAPNTGSYTWSLPDRHIDNMILRVGTDSSTITVDQTQPITVYQCSQNLPDLNNDCLVDFSDLLLLLSDWLQCGNPFEPGCL